MCGFEHMWWGGGFLMMVFWTVIFIAIAIWIFKTIQNQKNGRRPTNLNLETPLDLLKKRYARGEINKEEFDRIRKDLLE